MAKARSGTEGAHIRKRPREIFGGRDPYLLDIEPKDLKNLTKLLTMPKWVDPRAPDKEWRRDQRRRMDRLDYRLLKPRDLLTRAALKLGKQKIPYFPEPAPLCKLHDELDPRVVHNLMLMVANECTLRADKYRHACRYPTPKIHHVALPPEIEDWIDRLDRVTAQRLGGAYAFAEILRYMPKLSLSARMKGCTCEACLLAYIGGNDRVLADLWAGVKFREDSYKVHHRGREPRLLRIIESWLLHHDEESQTRIRIMRDKLLPNLEEARAIIIEHERVQDVAMRQMGKHSSSSHRHKGSHRSGRSKRQHGDRAPTSSSRPDKSSKDHRGKHADKRARPQSGRMTTEKGTTSSKESSTARPMTNWPSPFEFQVIEDEESKGSSRPTYSPPDSPLSPRNNGDYDEEHSGFVSPLTSDDGNNDASWNGRLAPPAGVQYPTTSQRHAFQDDGYGEFDEEDEELAAAEAWFERRTAHIDSTERGDIAEGISAFSAFQSPSAVPEALRPSYSREAEAEAEASDTDSWCSATVHTYVSQRPPTATQEPVPRPPSSRYTSDPISSRYSMAEAALHEEPPVPWEQWQKRFAHEETLARLEGR
ncbi:hypothetical protein NLU13_2790 [Sarocladium strictum]|uniref:Uncharacterized protein n=1 Tax=Sarocladium strictum TaxID=5046 RepID=A0AA39GKT1_SARSR|nr:hypothetical protein NLU13_2790 [Sarocladium strictum]